MDLEVNRRLQEMIKEAEEYEKLSREASKKSAELALLAAELRRKVRILDRRAFQTGTFRPTCF